MSTPAFFHFDSGCVRFWVEVDGVELGASVSREALHHRYQAHAVDDEPLATYHRHIPELQAAVHRRLALGSRPPVFLREADLRELPSAA